VTLCFASNLEAASALLRDEGELPGQSRLATRRKW